MIFFMVIGFENLIFLGIKEKYGYNWLYGIVFVIFMYFLVFKDV